MATEPATGDSDRTSGAGTFILVSTLVVVAWIFTWILPQGAFERVTDEAGRTTVVSGSYAPVAESEQVRLGPWAIPAAIPGGLDRAKGVIFFILIVGGTFRVLRETGAAEAAIGRVLERFGHRRNSLIMAGLIVFAAGSSTIGMAEEYLPFVPILVLFGIGLGLDRTAAVGIVIIGKAIGYGTAAINPFTLLVAQGISDLPPTSGMWFRLAIVAPFLLLGFDHLRRHANRLERRGLILEAPVASAESSPPAGPVPPPSLTPRRLGVLMCLVATIAAIVIGVMRHGWYLDEMMALFLVATIVIGIAGALSAMRIAALFGRGAAELAPTALLIGFAYSILVVLERGQVVDTVIHAIATPLERLGGEFSAVGMLAVQSVCNLVIPSGSGQAGVTMPIMAAVADLTGVTRQTAVLAFQFGDGLTNMIIPTNVILLGMLSLAGVSYAEWFRFIWPLMVKMLLLAAIVLVIAVWVGFK